MMVNLKIAEKKLYQFLLGNSIVIKEFRHWLI